MKIAILGISEGTIRLCNKLKDHSCSISVVHQNSHFHDPSQIFPLFFGSLFLHEAVNPLPSIFSQLKNTKLILSKPKKFNPFNKTIELENGVTFGYDTLFLNQEKSPALENSKWEEHLSFFYSPEDAVNLRRKICLLLEKVEYLTDFKDIDTLLSFSIIGNSKTSLELAFWLKEMLEVNCHFFPRVPKEKIKIHLHQDTIQNLSTATKLLLKQANIEIITDKITKIDEIGIHFEKSVLKTKNIIWTKEDLGYPVLAKTEPIKRNPDLCLNNFGNVFLFGYDNIREKPVLLMQQAEYFAKIIKRELGKNERKPFKCFNFGSFVNLGPKKATLNIGNIKLKGLVAFAWCLLIKTFKMKKAPAPILRTLFPKLSFRNILYY